MHRVQEEKLYYYEEQEDYARPFGVQEILPVLSKAYAPSRDQVRAVRGRFTKEGETGQ